jgi:hypothetical protein
MIKFQRDLLANLTEQLVIPASVVQEVEIFASSPYGLMKFVAEFK